jgi:hypothetical protein
MTNIKTIILQVVGVGMGLSLAVPGSALLAYADTRLTADTKLERIGQPLTDEEMRAVSFSAGRILKHVDQAIQAIAKQDKNTALMQIDKGLTLAGIIEQSLPLTTVKSTIKSGKLQYSDEDKVRPLTVPIYQELDTVSILEPVVAAKKAAVAKDGKASAKGRVEEVGESYIRITLNVADAKAYLETAKDELAKGHFDAASRNLQAIQEKVTVMYAGERGPLAEAREDLALAHIDIDQGFRKEAQVALTDASESLSRYEKSGGKHQADVKTMQTEIAALTAELDKTNEGSKEKAKGTIMGWWDRVKGWEHRHFSSTDESPTTGLEKGGPYVNR